MKSVKIRFCPKCGSQEVKLVAGGNLGMFECKECGFRGAVFPEKEVSEDYTESGENKGKSKENKKEKHKDDK